MEAKSGREVVFESFSDLVGLGKIRENSMFFRHCTKYGLEHVLRQGYSYISPDCASVEALEAIASVREVRSVLEIGAGVGICGRAAERLGIQDYTFVEVRPEVCRYVRERLPYPVVEKNAFDFAFDRNWDVVLMGMDYELNPWFLAEKGEELARHASLVVFQSGCPAFFELEHDWINGKHDVSNWPWWSVTQTLPHYFLTGFTCAYDWQLATVAGHDPQFVVKVQRAMKKSGFSDVPRNYVEL